MDWIAPTESRCMGSGLDGVRRPASCHERATCARHLQYLADKRDPERAEAVRAALKASEVPNLFKLPRTADGCRVRIVVRLTSK